jgi:hypothetical protein
MRPQAASQHCDAVDVPSVRTCESVARFLDLLPALFSPSTEQDMPTTAIVSGHAAGRPGVADRVDSAIDHPHTLNALAGYVAHIAMCVLIAAAPFELTRPFIQLPH